MHLFEQAVCRILILNSLQEPDIRYCEVSRRLSLSQAQIYADYLREKQIHTIMIPFHHYIPC